MATALTALAAYCIGSVSFAIVVSRLMRLPDPRSYGSKNPGATNVLRTGRKTAAVLTLAGDAGKGWLAVWLPPQPGGAGRGAGPGGFPRTSLSGVPPLPGRQGRRDRRRRAVRSGPAARPRCARRLDRRCGAVPLLLARVSHCGDRRDAVRVVPRRGRARRRGGRRDRGSARLAPPRKHRTPRRRDRVAARPQES